jgi:hypothetical protein
MDGIADPNVYPYLEKTGDDGLNGFQCSTGFGSPYDYAENGMGNQLGQYFLRTTAFSLTNGTETLLVSYITPVTLASGEIWDIDANVQGTEQWRIEALNENLQVCTNVLTPAGIDYRLDESFDGLPWSFNIEAGGAEKIAALRFVFVGSKTNDIGLAFNNFSPAQQLGTTNIIGVAKIDPALEISWHSQLGYTYQLQWTQGLGGQWHDVGG